GKPWLSFGLMGGGMQPQGHVQILTNLIDFGMNLQEAGDVARWRHDGSSEPTGVAADGVGTLRVESGIPFATREALKRKGHRVKLGKGGFGGYQAILLDPETGVYIGASEMRKDGCAIGY
ncbi:MAG: gamma-glutamyltransferase, partial [Myxococcota bacterium]